MDWIDSIPYHPELEQEGYDDGICGMVYKNPMWTDSERDAYNLGQARACRERGKDDIRE